MDDVSATGPLSDDEAEVFRQLLIRYCAFELDQFDLWRTTGPNGPAYITIARYPNGDQSQSPDAWVSIDENPRSRGDEATSGDIPRR